MSLAVGPRLFLNCTVTQGVALGWYEPGRWPEKELSGMKSARRVLKDTVIVSPPVRWLFPGATTRGQRPRFVRLSLVKFPIVLRPVVG